MKRTRLLSLLIALIMLLGMLPQMTIGVSAEDGLPDLQNMKVSSGGLVTWDPYPGAAHYWIGGNEFLGSSRIDPDKPLRFDLAGALADAYAPNGTYTLVVDAEDEGYNSIARSTVTWTFTGGLPRLATPTNIRWDGYTAKWDAVEGAENGYYVYLNDVTIGWNADYTSTKKTEVDFSRSVVNKEHEYAFYVYAVGCPSGSRSEDSPLSPAIPGRFIRDDLYLMCHDLSGESVLTWSQYVDTEGNTAPRYDLFENYENPAFIYNVARSNYFRGGFPIERVLYHIDAPSGTYKYSIEAENAEGITVSKESNEVAVDYVADTSSPSVQYTGCKATNGSLGELRIDGMHLSLGTELKCKKGATMWVVAYADHNHEIEGLRISYGDEIREEPERITDTSVRTDGGIFWEITVPDEDFGIVIDQSVVYDWVSEVEVGYDETAGKLARQTLTRGSGDYYAYINSIRNESGSEYGWLLPGKTYEVNFYAYTTGYYKFTDGVTLTMNGNPVEITSVEEDNTKIRGTYEFTVPAAGSVILAESGSMRPRMDIKNNSGRISWTAPADTAYYYVWATDYISSESIEGGVTSYDLKSALADRHAPSGWYVFEIDAYDAEDNEIAYDYIAYYFAAGLPRLATPTNLRWDGYTAKWDPVEGASYYNITLFNRDNLNQITSDNIFATEFDFSNYTRDKLREYMFTVTAYPDEESDYSNSERSPFSPWIEGRYLYEEYPITLSGDTLSWDVYTDTEGIPADHYYYYFEGVNEGYYRTMSFTYTSVNLRQVFEMYDFPDDKYEIYGYAENCEGYSVSDCSNSVFYDYVADARTTVILDGWQYGGDGSSYSGVHRLYVNGLNLYRYDSYKMNAGETATVSITPEERYRLTNLYLYYGEELHEVTGFSERPDGSYGASFTIPDEDFNLVIRSEWILYDIPTVECSFSETPGDMLAHVYLDKPDEAPYSVSISGIEGPHGGGNAVMRPGAEYTVTLQVYADYGYKLPDDVQIYANGNLCTIDSFSDDHRYVYATYTFVPTMTIDTITVYGAMRPAYDNAQSVDVYADYSDPYTILSDYTGWYRLEDGGSWASMEYGETFEEGGNYILQIAYLNVEGCPWGAGLTVVIPDESVMDQVDHIYVGDGSSIPGAPKIVEIHFKPVPGPEPIDTAECTLGELRENTHPDYDPTSGDGDKYKVSVDRWVYDEDDQTLDETAAFWAGNEYTVYVEYRPLGGFYFTDSTTFTINGTTVSAVIDGSGYAHASLTLTCPRIPGALERAECLITPPYVGEHPDMSPVSADPELYDVSVYTWYDDALGAYLDETGVFVKDHRLNLRVYFEPKDGVVFDSMTEFYINGVRADSRFSTGYGYQIDLYPEIKNPFTDVKKGAFYYDAVMWAVSNDPVITKGTTATTFSPKDTCTRGQVVTFLWRAFGCPEPTLTENPFTDVKEKAFYYKAVLWAVEKGITNGVDATHFGPDQGCTRGQVVAFLWRAEGQPEPASTENPFTDVKEKAFYYKAVLWAVEKNITNGTTPTTFGPGATCTRGQIVTFLFRDRG
ncbi:MAG: S-layer homology domain-containing protein [Clostridia bacterium]|nr:S-layer homology domain-containing protein [Clostridia bacterium]